MRWPFPRREHRSITDRSDGDTIERARPSTPPARHDVAPPRAAARTDWTKLPPIAGPTTPPITFDSIGFGQNVSGARPLTPPRPRRHRSEAPVGLLVDIAIVDHQTVEVPAARGPDTSVPRSEVPPAALRHVERVVEARDAAGDLMASDVQWNISSWTRPEPLDDDVLHATSWTAESGFVIEGIDSNEHDGSRGMRLVGQRGSFDEAVAPAGSTADPEPTRETSDVPSLRYVPMPGERDTHDGPPADLVAVVRAATGVDVGTARIDRSAATTDRAAALGAIAFTQRGVVHLPNELGPIDDPAVRAITAHELTHVAQQRTRGGAPDESSAEGRRLEREAQAVERSVGNIGAVTPTFLRTRTHQRTPIGAGQADHVGGATRGDTGLQRLAGDDDQFDWQQRPDPQDRQRPARQVLGAFSFVLGRPRELDDEQQRTNTRQFEMVHAQELQARRDERFDEMLEEAERQLRLRDLRNDVAESEASELDRADHLDLRRRLDDEMPWEFGPPSGIDPYPGELPPEDESSTGRHRREDGTTDERDERHVANADGTAPERRVATAPDAPTIGANSGNRRGASLRHRTGGPRATDDEPDFGWQDRGTTQNDAATAVLGGALGGMFNSLFGDSAETEASDREAAERKALPTLHAKRQGRERALRRESLDRKRAQAMRREDPFPLQLDQSDIVAIRVALDEEMPLEFNDPEYLPSDIAVSIDHEGAIGDAVEHAESADDEQGADDEEGADADQDANDAEPTAEATDDESVTATPIRSDEPTDDEDESTAEVLGARMTGAGIAGLRSSRDESADDEHAANESVDDEDRDDADAASRILAAASDIDLDQLARRLYGRVRRDLRQELLIDRERAGVLADVH